MWTPEKTAWFILGLAMVAIIFSIYLLDLLFYKFPR